MKTRNYAIAFVVILIVFCLGAYAGISGFLLLGDRLAKFWARSDESTSVIVSQPTPTPWVPVAPTSPTIPTPEPPTPTPIPPTPTPKPPTATPAMPTTATPSTSMPTQEPTSTRTRRSSYLFEPAGPVLHDTEHACTANYIRGTVVDSEGKPLEGVRVRAYDQWGNEAYAVSKGGVDLGQYDIVIGGAPDIWWALVVDGEGNPLSPEMQVPHRQEGPGEKACWHWVDWQRTR